MNNLTKNEADQPEVTEAGLAHERRKDEHIRICLEENVNGEAITTGFERFHFIHQALPEIDLAKIDLTSTIFGRVVQAPFLISSMTGGATKAAELNKRLASAAQTAGIAMGLGSQRTAISRPDLRYSYEVRDVAPDILLFANIGAIQLNYGYGLSECQAAVEMIGADGLILHLNALQEAVQPNGNTNFSGLLSKIEEVCHLLKVPVLVKEVGWGLSAEVARQLINVGVSGLDCAGAGGTSWSQVEKFRSTTKLEYDVANSFANWGISTAESLRQVRQVCQDASQTLIIASGGIRNGIEAAKGLVLGANMIGVGRQFLQEAAISTEALSLRLSQMRKELEITMFCLGTKDLASLKATPHLRHQNELL